MLELLVVDDIAVDKAQDRMGWMNVDQLHVLFDSESGVLNFDFQFPKSSPPIEVGYLVAFALEIEVRNNPDLSFDLEMHFQIPHKAKSKSKSC